MTIGSAESLAAGDPTSALLDRLGAVSGARVTQDYSFADLTTLRIGGAPKAVVEVHTPEAVAEVVRELAHARVNWIVVGGGSNLVVADSPAVHELIALRLVVKKPVLGEDTGAFPVAPVLMDVSSGIVSAFGGVDWDSLVAATVTSGLGGLECLSGIPGSVGATPVQNVGAYGVEVSALLQRVLLTYTGTDGHEAGSTEWVDPSELELAYRYSNLKFTRRAVVTAVEFRLTTDGQSAPLRYGELARELGVSQEEVARPEGARRPVAEVREAVLKLRRGKGMVLLTDDHDTWSAGSFFTNPIIPESELAGVRSAVAARCGAEVAESMPAFTVDGGIKLSAAWLIDKSGLNKGWSVSGSESAPASLSHKHTLALTNRGSATSTDIAQLAQAVQAHVKAAFGVQLEPEPVFVGF